MQKNANYNEVFGPQEDPFPRVGHLDRGPHSLKCLRKVPVARRGVTPLVSGGVRGCRVKRVVAGVLPLSCDCGACWLVMGGAGLWASLVPAHGPHPTSQAPLLQFPFGAGGLYHVAFSCILRRHPWQFGTNLFSHREQLFWFLYWAYYLWLKVLFWY